MANFTKSDIADALRTRIAGLSKVAADDAVTGIFQILRQEAEAGKTVTIHGFGRFVIRERPARSGRNPRTGETIQIAASRSLAFKPSKSST